MHRTAFAEGLLVLKGHSLQDRWHGLTAPFMSFVLRLGCFSPVPLLAEKVGQIKLGL